MGAFLDLQAADGLTFPAYVAQPTGAALAAWWPARQAARTAPMEALRQD